MPVRRVQRKLIGEILLEEGLITRRQLEQALRAQEESRNLHYKLLLACQTVCCALEEQRRELQ